MAAAGELRCVDSAIESVLEDIDSALILKEEQRNAIKAFVDRKYVFAVKKQSSVNNTLQHCSELPASVISVIHSD